MKFSGNDLKIKLIIRDNNCKLNFQYELLFSLKIFLIKNPKSTMKMERIFAKKKTRVESHAASQCTL